MPQKVAASSNGSILEFKSLGIDFTDQADSQHKATWSDPDKITIAKVDADAEKSLGKKFDVQGFPTIKYFDGKSKTPEDYDGGRDIDSLTEFITKKTGVKPKKAKGAPSAVTMLTDRSFKEQIGSDKDVIVAFTAPWCGREFPKIYRSISALAF